MVSGRLISWILCISGTPLAQAENRQNEIKNEIKIVNRRETMGKLYICLLLMSDSILTGLNFIIQRNLRDFLDGIKIKFPVVIRLLTYLVYGQRIMSARVSDLQ